MTCAFISDHKIDSYLKLQLVLLLHRSKPLSLTLDELADQVFLGDLGSLERLLRELDEAGLLCVDARRRWGLSDRTEVCYCLRCLQRTFDDPLARQRLLSQISAAQPSRVS